MIREVLEAEAAAREMVRAAQAEADQRIAEARGRAEETVAQARRESRLEATQSIERAALQALEEKSSRLRQAESRLEQEVVVDERLRDRLVEAAVRCIEGDG